MLARQSILSGDSSVVVAGGQESMSQSVHALSMREGTKFGNKEMVDTMLCDGLTDAFNHYHMGITGEFFKCQSIGTNRFDGSRNRDRPFLSHSLQPRTSPSVGA